MELHDLKNIWKKYATQVAETPALQPDELRKLLKQRSESAIMRLRRTLQWEGLALVVAVLLLSAVVLFKITLIWFQVIISGIVVSAIVMAVYMWRSAHLLKNLQVTHLSLRDGINKALHIMEYYLKVYYTLTMILTGQAFFAGFFAGVLAKKTVSIEAVLAKPLTWGILAVTLVLVLAGAHFSLKYFMKILYRKHLTTLRNCLQELNEANDPETGVF